MKKFEFMKLENAPQFIKDLIDDLPDDVEIGFKSLNLSNETLNKQSDKQPDKCENCQRKNADGVNIGPQIETIYTMLNELSDLADCEGRVSLEDAGIIRCITDLMEESLDYIHTYMNIKKDKKGKKA